MRVALALLAVLPVGPGQAHPAPDQGTVQAVTVVDDRGHTVLFAQPPQRIVSLLPALTESVCALGACDRLVGVDRYSRHPESVRTLPVLGGGLDPNIEAVLALRPDVVLAAVSTRAVPRLEALGLRVVALEPQTRADVQRVLQRLEAMLRGPASDMQLHGDLRSAHVVWQQIEQGMQAAAARLPVQARGVRVFFEVGQGPYAAGPQSFIGETLQRLGVHNVVPEQLGPFPRLAPEFVLRADPDILMTGVQAAGLAYPGWSGMRAVRQGRICRFDAQAADVLVRPGPRMAEAAALMAQCIADHVPPAPPQQTH
ncbi:ABC transporter substrate-binding protein [Lampropedia cohaerens]|uniref:ABC transporter substrate-binding protein n=1 Tax=Lampropedia cohaerens TaxID=1610491 RepID=UPI000A07CD9B